MDIYISMFSSLACDEKLENSQFCMFPFCIVLYVGKTYYPSLLCTGQFHNNTSTTDVAPWCYKWVGLDWIGSPGGVKYRAPYGANKQVFVMPPLSDE